MMNPPGGIAGEARSLPRLRITRRRSFRKTLAAGGLLGSLSLAMTPAIAAEDGVSSDQIVIGTSLALTGPIAVCAGVADGANAYFKRVNDAGGVHGRKIKFVVLDDAYSTQRAIGNVRRLMEEDKVFAFFSGCGTATGAAVLSVVGNESIPYLFPEVGLNQLVQPPKKNVFSILPLYGQQLSTIIGYVAKRQPLKTAAISMINIAGHEGWMEAIHAKLAALHIQVIDEQLVDVTSPEKATFVTEMKSKNPDLVVLVESSPGAARYLLEMQRQNWAPKVVTGTSTMSDESFLRAAGSAADTSANTRVIVPAVTLPVSDPKAKECVDDLKNYNSALIPSSYTMFGCMGAKLFVNALGRITGEPTRAGLIAQLEATHGFDTGFSGSINFTASTRQGLTSVYPITVENGKFKVLGPPISLD